MKELQPLNIIVRESLDHFTPIGKDWYEGFKKAGHNVTLVSNKQELFNTSADSIDIFVNMVTVDDPDVGVFLCKLKERNSKAITLSTVHNTLEKHENWFDVVDFWFDCGYSHPVYEEWFGSRQQNFISVLEATNLDTFHKIHNTQLQERDYSFIGQFGERGHGFRDQDKYLFPFVEDSSIKGYLFGFEYRPYVAMQHIRYSDLNLVYNASKVNLNFHYARQKNEVLVLNKRTFDIAASGNFQLVDHPLYTQLLGLPHYSDPKEYWEAFYYYLNNEKERSVVVEKALQEVRKNHTWEVRMINLIKQVYEIHNK